MLGVTGHYCCIHDTIWDIPNRKHFQNIQRYPRVEDILLEAEVQHYAPRQQRV